jgi:hypothetical protein
VKIRHIPVLAGLAIVLLACGCSSVSVQHDWNENTDFNRFRSFRVLDRPASFAGDPLVWNRLHDALRDELESRAYTENTTDPDFLVAVHIDVQDRVNVQTYNYGYGVYSDWHGRDIAVSQYQEGTLVIDFVDASDNEVFWRGWGTKILDGKTREPAVIRDIVSKIISQYPPK